MEDFEVNLDDLPDKIDLTEIAHEIISKTKKQHHEIVPAETREYKAKIKYEQLITARAKSFNDIVSLDLIENTQYRIVTSMSFNAITVIQYLIKYYQITEMSIAIFRMNNKTFDYLKELILKDDIRTNIIVSVFFSNNKKYERWANDLRDIAASLKNVNVGYSNIHTKVFICKTKCGKHIVFEGSGNLTHNERLEQYIYENNKQAYNFHKSWIEFEIK